MERTFWMMSSLVLADPRRISRADSAADYMGCLVFSLSLDRWIHCERNIVVATVQCHYSGHTYSTAGRHLKTRLGARRPSSADKPICLCPVTHNCGAFMNHPARRHDQYYRCLLFLSCHWKIFPTGSVELILRIHHSFMINP